MGGESVDNPKDSLGGRDCVGHQTYPTHSQRLVSTLNCSPELWRELSDVNDRRQVANQNDHDCFRVLVTIVTISELITRLTHAATMTGMASVPMP
jgi:hypothetical protein